MVESFDHAHHESSYEYRHDLFQLVWLCQGTLDLHVVTTQRTYPHATLV